MDHFSYRLYISLIAITAVSLLFAAAPFLPDSVRTILALPAFAAIVGIIIQLFRDQLAHEHAKELQVQQQDFTIGIASKMSETVFQRQVKFCEKYVEVVNHIVDSLDKEGPTEAVIPLANELTRMRAKNVVWLTREQNNRLYLFERRVTEIGVNDYMTKLVETDMERYAFHDAKYKALFEVRGYDNPGPEKPKVSSDAILEYVKAILGTDGLVALREVALKSALERALPVTKSS